MSGWRRIRVDNWTGLVYALIIFFVIVPIAEQGWRLQ